MKWTPEVNSDAKNAVDIGQRKYHLFTATIAADSIVQTASRYKLRLRLKKEKTCTGKPNLRNHAMFSG